MNIIISPEAAVGECVQKHAVDGSLPQKHRLQVVDEPLMRSQSVHQRRLHGPHLLRGVSGAPPTPHASARASRHGVSAASVRISGFALLRHIYVYKLNPRFRNTITIFKQISK